MLTRLLLRTRPIRYWFDRKTFAFNADCQAIINLRNKYKGLPMLVIGNGPSLNKTPLDEFCHVPSIGVNKINLLFHRVSWRPILILCVNNLVVQQNWQTFVQNKIPVFLSWKARWFIPRSERRSVSYFLSLPSSEFSLDPTEGVGSAGTVTYTALQFAYFMGANPVILFGVDHSFSYEGRTNEIVKMEGSDPNHFDPNYFAEGQKWGLPNFDRIELAYRNAKNAFEKDKRLIYDATIGGKLDIFPKISVETAKRICML